MSAAEAAHFDAVIKEMESLVQELTAVVPGTDVQGWNKKSYGYVVGTLTL